jgi:hypothetical protein
MIYLPGKVTDPIVYRELLKISAALSSLKEGKISVLTVEPVKPREGMLFICDGVHWNPLADGIKRPVWFDGTIWRQFT